MTTPGGRRRRTRVLAGLGVVVLAGGLAAKLWWPQDSTTVVEAEDALDRFRGTTTTADASSTPPPTSATPAGTDPPAAPQALPAPGVYRYRTTGVETVDILGGATHTYPSETLLTVIDEGCGILLRWDLLEERREEWRLCIAPDGIEYQATALQFHEFFDNGRTEQMVCNDDVLLLPGEGTTAPAVGQAQAVTCLLDGRPWNPKWTYVGDETVLVDGVEIAARHLRIDVAMDGDHYEFTTIDWWLAADGLPLRMATTKESKTDSGVIGDVVYTEEYDVSLVSLTPLT